MPNICNKNSVAWDSSKSVTLFQILMETLSDLNAHSAYVIDRFSECNRDVSYGSSECKINFFFSGKFGLNVIEEYESSPGRVENSSDRKASFQPCIKEKKISILRLYEFFDGLLWIREREIEREKIWANIKKRYERKREMVVRWSF